MYPLVEIKQHDEPHHVKTQTHRFFYWEYDIKKNLLRLSSHFIFLLGLNPQVRLKHEHLIELMHPDDQSKHQALFEKLKEGKVESYEHTFRIHNQEGEYLHIEEQGEIFAYDKDGVVVKILGSYTLVAPKHIEKTKYAKELPLEYSEYWVWEIDTLGYLTYVNEDSTQILGYPAKELLGKNIFDLMPKIELQRVLPIYQKAFEDKKPIKELLNATRHQKGDTLYFLVNAKPFYDDQGDFIGYRGVSKDISKEVHLEQELNKYKIILSQREEELKLANTQLIEKAKQEAFKSKAQFLTNMSQDLRSPMKNIITIASQTLDEELPRQKRDSCEKIQTSARTLLEVMDDILDLSQYSAGKLSIENEDFDLLESIDTMMHSIDIKAHAKRISVDISYDREVKRYYKGDAKRLTQILSNVLSTTIHLSEASR
ncbi:MAG: PAS domain S-box protein, partial [Campylobacterota bacterium]|nr:PAS domain S-box protein [Campylobacterota bacterium]